MVSIYHDTKNVHNETTDLEANLTFSTASAYISSSKIYKHIYNKNEMTHLLIIQQSQKRQRLVMILWWKDVRTY